MQCPFGQFYEEPVFDEDYFSEEYDASYETCNPPLCQCIGNDRPNSCRNRKQIDCKCCRCIEVKKPKVKGKFGVAYVVKTPKESYCEPSGWQVEFQDTPSQIDRNCQKMLKWITCPPLGECYNNETNFLRQPSECAKLLSIDMKKCCCMKKPVENCCQPKEKSCVCSRNRSQCQKLTKSKPCCFCLKSKKSCTCLSKQMDKFMLCKKCCKALTCSCGQPPSACCCEPKKLKCVCQSPFENCKCDSESKLRGICQHCQKSKSYYCTIEEHICPNCGKVMEKNCYVKENCVCVPYDAGLDYIPRRESCPKKKCKEVNECSSEIKKNKLSNSNTRKSQKLLEDTPRGQTEQQKQSEIQAKVETPQPEKKETEAANVNRN